MKIKENICHRRLTRNLSILFQIILCASCQKDLQIDSQTSLGIRFMVSDGIGWQSTRTAAGDTEEMHSSDSVLDVRPLFAKDGDDGLYLHTSVSDKISVAFFGTEDPQTRAMPVETATVYDSFGVLTSVYSGSWSETTCTPDYMYNVEVSKASSWTTSYYWPGRGTRIRFFAYAPYNGEGIVLSDKTKAGTPTISYTVPTAVSAQSDLLVAVSAELSDNTSAAVPLTFEHALTAVRIATGDDMKAGSITKITLKGVYGSGTHMMGSDSWRDYGAKRDFEQTLSVQADGTADQEITPVASTFMMVPQTLPAGAMIEIAYTDDLTSSQRTLTASIAGGEWPIGKTVTYRISTSSISIVPTFTVKAPASYTYKGGSDSYTVTSYVSVSRSGDETKAVAMAWSAEFVEDDGTGNYRVITRPDWLTEFTTSGNGGTSAATFTATTSAQQGIISNPHNDRLKTAKAVQGVYNLSNPTGAAPVLNTANCYVVNAPGTYSLPLVYGNAIKDGMDNPSAYTSAASGSNVLKNFVNHRDVAITSPYIYNNADCRPVSAQLVWQDEPNLVTNIRLSTDKKHLLFDVNVSTIKQGNAIVAVCDDWNFFMWSWHIWVTDFVPGLAPTVEHSYDPAQIQRDKVVTNYQNVKYTFMGVNIGWCDAETETYPARSVKIRFTQAETGVQQVVDLTQVEGRIARVGNNPYFQSGRKDPMLPGIVTSTGSSARKGCYPSEGFGFTHVEGRTTIGTSILNPHVFYTSKSSTGEYNYNDQFNWCSSYYINLWSANNTQMDINDNLVVKTIYDPSPAGYHLPASRAFSGFSCTGRKNLTGHENFGAQFNSPYSSDDDVYNNGGWTFYCDKMLGESSYDTMGGVIFFPISGHIDYLTGEPKYVGLRGWSIAATGNLKTPYTMYMHPIYIAVPHDNYMNNDGYPARPVRE